ncbi:discoidin domain-containing protein [Paenibacillus taichungensis]|uniref:discoidin domain-containing protein n=1 Tax=Paenibacillus taichungensis TaxID=484184 RepID=UPI002DBCB13F|nr:discoidin domain-containing protein [Paenibacillus taichungensis]MEC0107382.1 discoidin domain-containing protein [Paenibacillus taichungensis]MEC0195577.1 discoidin domain-containing protein [Paenibacillus taichungensis]
MRRKWPFLLLAFTLTVGLSVPGTQEVRASEGDSQPSIDLAGENLSLGTDGRSRLYPNDWYPGFKDEQGRFLHDFSYAGYRRGETELPKTAKNKRIDVTKSPYFADPSGGRDATQAIQKAIDAAVALGGGVVYLPKGTYQVNPQDGKDYSLNIPASRVVLKGDGMNKTHIYNAQQNMKNKDIIRIGNGDWKKTGISTKLRKSVTDPTVLLPVEDTSGFAVNDYVVISFETTPGFLRELGMQNKWSSRLGKVEPLFYRQIVGVDSENKTITLDIPTRYPMKLRDDITISQTADPIVEVGLEDFSIANIQNAKSGLGEDDFKVVGTAGYEADNAKAVNVIAVANSWIRNINTYKPAGNTDYHLLSKGIILDRTKNVTVDHVTMQYPQYRGANGNGYLYQFIGNDNLIKNSKAIGARHSFTYANFSANGNVLQGSYSEKPSLLTDFHMYLSMANLIDNLVVNGDGISAITRDYGSSETNRHGVVTTESVFWNTTGQAAHPSKSGVIVESEQFGNGYVIGTKGKDTGVNVNIVGSIPDANTQPFDMAEGIGQGDRLSPQSLYQDQSKKRIKDLYLGLQSLLVNGEAIEGMQFLRTDYVHTLPYGTTETPIISAKAYAKDAKVKIKQPQGTNGTGEITVSYRGHTQNIRVKFKVADTPVLPENISISPNKAVPGWRVAGNAISAGGSGELSSFLTLDNGEIVNIAELNVPVTYTSSDDTIGYTEGTTFHAVKAGKVDIVVSCVFNGVTVEAREKFEVKEPMVEPEGPFAVVTKVTASADDGNLPIHTIDRDPDSRWSADGKGQYLQLELEQQIQVGQVSIQFYNGHTRSNYFDLEISTDGINYQKVLSNVASQKQAAYETFEFEPIQAKFIRYVGQGNESNTWNSIIEFWVHEN